jgi:hypothetical protein
MNCRVADFIGYSIFLEIFLEMRFLIAFGVPEKSVFTRLFCVFASALLANFQDRLVMTASWLIGVADITLRMNLYLPILPHSSAFVKRTKAKRLPQVAAF